VHVSVNMNECGESDRTSKKSDSTKVEMEGEATICAVKSGSPSHTGEPTSPSESHPENEHRSLIDAIQNGDLVQCQRIVTRTNLRLLNKPGKVKHSQYENIVATPLLAAVLLRKREIVELLLDKKVKVEKKGFYRDQNTVYTVTPLLKAIMNCDYKLVEMLLERGAKVQVGVAGPKIAEEEGYYCQYTKMVYPLNVAMSTGLCMFKPVFKNASVLLEYGENRHTCLCYAIGYYLSNPDTVDPSFIQFIIQRGGKICAYQGRDLPCIYLQNLVWESIKIPYKVSTDSRKSSKGPVSFVSNHHHIQVLELLSCTDYNHKNSSFHCIVSRHSDYLQSKLSADKLTDINHCCEKSRQFYRWIESSSRTPSSLTDITRCAIRNFIPDISPEKCETLPLPTHLIDNLSLNVELPVVIKEEAVPLF